MKTRYLTKWSVQRKWLDVIVTVSDSRYLSGSPLGAHVNWYKLLLSTEQVCSFVCIQPTHLQIRPITIVKGFTKETMLYHDNNHHSTTDIALNMT